MAQQLLVPQLKAKDAEDGDFWNSPLRIDDDTMVELRRMARLAPQCPLVEEPDVDEHSQGELASPFAPAFPDIGTTLAQKASFFLRRVSRIVDADERRLVDPVRMLRIVALGEESDTGARWPRVRRCALRDACMYGL